MHPAFSVIFFSTLTGLGYGVLVWTAASVLRHRSTWVDEGVFLTSSHALLLAASFVLITVGLLSSLGHLGKPLRAWRAFSQWRTSWLSREGVLAVASFLPLFVLVDSITEWVVQSAGPGYPPGLPTSGVLAGVGCMVGAIATVTCTAMIYASLKPIPAWRHWAVVPAYLLFSLQGGLLGFASITSLDEAYLTGWALPAIIGAVALAVLKVVYWRDIDQVRLPASRSTALGLPADRTATVFERPHTEASYLTKEMGFVVARKHARRLRAIAVLLFALVPALCCTIVFLAPPLAAPLAATALLSTLLGTLVERWLFFAEAKHLVTLYY